MGEAKGVKFSLEDLVAIFRKEGYEISRQITFRGGFSVEGKKPSYTISFSILDNNVAVVDATYSEGGNFVNLRIEKERFFVRVILVDPPTDVKVIRAFRVAQKSAIPIQEVESFIRSFTSIPSDFAFDKFFSLLQV
jgi:hypothetical protein